MPSKRPRHARPQKKSKATPVRRRPGAKCVRSGQYRYEDAYGELSDNETTSVRGEPMPPPPRGMRGGIWVLADATRHARG